MSMAQSYKVFIGNSSILFLEEVSGSINSNLVFEDPSEEILLGIIEKLEAHKEELKVFVVGMTRKLGTVQLIL